MLYLEKTSDLIAAVRVIGKANPGFSYSETYGPSALCAYVDKDTLEGKCLLGRAGIAAGLNPKVFIDFNLGSIARNIAKIVKELDANEVNWLKMVQNKQDAGECWADAIKAADEEYLKL